MHLRFSGVSGIFDSLRACFIFETVHAISRQLEELISVATTTRPKSFIMPNQNVDLINLFRSGMKKLVVASTRLVGWVNRKAAVWTTKQ